MGLVRHVREVVICHSERSATVLADIAAEREVQDDAGAIAVDHGAAVRDLLALAEEARRSLDATGVVADQVRRAGDLRVMLTILGAAVTAWAEDVDRRHPGAVRALGEPPV